MAFADSEKKQVDWILQKFWQRNRPPERARHQVDLSYEIKNQSVEIFLLRAFWRDTYQTVRGLIVKATYDKVILHGAFFRLKPPVPDFLTLATWGHPSPHPTLVPCS